MFGYIQLICLSPSIIMLWTEADIRLYHDRCEKSVLYLHATGCIVREFALDSDRKVCNYSLVLQHSLPGPAPIAVAEMFSNSHTAVIGSFLSQFLAKVRMVFDHLRLPKKLEVDFSYPMIQCAEFICEGRP